MRFGGTGRRRQHVCRSQTSSRRRAPRPAACPRARAPPPTHRAPAPTPTHTHESSRHHVQMRNSPQREPSRPLPLRHFLELGWWHAVDAEETAQPVSVQPSSSPEVRVEPAVFRSCWATSCQASPPPSAPPATPGFCATSKHRTLTTGLYQYSPPWSCLSDTDSYAHLEFQHGATFSMKRYNHHRPRSPTNSASRQTRARLY